MPKIRYLTGVSAETIKTSAAPVKKCYYTDGYASDGSWDETRRDNVGFDTIKMWEDKFDSSDEIVHPMILDEVEVKAGTKVKLFPNYIFSHYGYIDGDDDMEVQFVCKGWKDEDGKFYAFESEYTVSDDESDDAVITMTGVWGGVEDVVVEVTGVDAESDPDGAKNGPIVLEARKTSDGTTYYVADIDSDDSDSSDDVTFYLNDSSDDSDNMVKPGSTSWLHRKGGKYSVNLTK